MKKVIVIGLGYIGLPTSLMLASNGISVTAVDYDANKVQDLQNGKVTFKEDGLEELYNQACKGEICFTTEYPKGDFYIIAVPTPYIEETKKLDPAYVISAFKNVLEVCEDGAIVSIESTISPGTIDREIRPLLSSTNKTINLGHTPERIIPGNMVYELVHNSRTIGADSDEVGNTIKDVYSSFCQGEIILTDIKTAEMSKVVENTFRDINIAFANELARICHEGNMDVYEVIRIANHHPRVNILQPGPGVGGHCISVDPWFLVGDYPTESTLIHTARNVNTEMPEYVWRRIKEIMKDHNISDISEVGLYGLTYKENVDDVRESPTFQLLDFIRKEGCPLPTVYDPMVSRQYLETQTFEFSDFIEKSKIVVILVGHQHLRNNLEVLSDKIVFDTRNITAAEYKL